MKTYNELLSLGTDEEKRKKFILEAIADHESSEKFKLGQIAGEFYRGNDPALEKVEKFFYDFNGVKHPDLVSPNHKIYNNFYFVIMTQMVSYSFGNGVSFDNPKIKERLGDDFDLDLMKVITNGGNDGESYALVTDTGIEPLCLGSDKYDAYFVPLVDYRNNKLMAGIRYWKLDDYMPLIVTLFEPDGYTKYEKTYQGSLEIVAKKKPYKLKVKRYPDLNEPEELEDISDYTGLPIARFNFINNQSAIYKKDSALSAYNATLSRLTNNVAESDFIYWVFENCSNMDEIDEAKAIVNILKTHALSLQEGVSATPHQLEVPYQASEANLQQLRKQIFNDFMAVDTETIRAGNITATEINTSYENINLKADALEACAIKFIKEVLKILGFDENEPFHFTRARNYNESEAIQNAIAASPFLGEEATTKTICEVTGKIDEYEKIQEQKMAESMSRFNANMINNTNTDDGESNNG